MPHLQLSHGVDSTTHALDENESSSVDSHMSNIFLADSILFNLSRHHDDLDRHLLPLKALKLMTNFYRFYPLFYLLM